MTTITNSTLSALRARFGRGLASRLPEHIGRLGWDARQLAAHQREQLRRCWHLRWSVPRSMPGVWPGSTPGGSSPASWLSCR